MGNRDLMAPWLFLVSPHLPSWEVLIKLRVTQSFFNTKPYREANDVSSCSTKTKINTYAFLGENLSKKRLLSSVAFSSKIFHWKLHAIFNFSAALLILVSDVTLQTSTQSYLQVLWVTPDNCLICESRWAAAELGISKGFIQHPGPANSLA